MNVLSFLDLIALDKIKLEFIILNTCKWTSCATMFNWGFSSLQLQIERDANKHNHHCHHHQHHRNLFPTLPYYPSWYFCVLKIKEFCLKSHSLSGFCVISLWIRNDRGMLMVSYDGWFSPPFIRKLELRWCAHIMCI